VVTPQGPDPRAGVGDDESPATGADAGQGRRVAGTGSVGARPRAERAGGGDDRPRVERAGGAGAERPAVAAGGNADDQPRAAGGDGAGDELLAGGGIVRFDVWATAVFVVVAVAAAIFPDPVDIVAVPLDLILFLIGCCTFLWAYALAIGRSRYETITMSGAFFLSGGVAPPPVTRLLRGLLAVQVVVAVAVAAVRPFTPLAFAVLVPMLGLGLMALWAARHGSFPAIEVPESPDPAEPDGPAEGTPPAQ
jgi:hypothetical protein